MTIPTAHTVTTSSSEQSTYVAAATFSSQHTVVTYAPLRGYPSEAIAKNLTPPPFFLIAIFYPINPCLRHPVVHATATVTLSLPATRATIAKSSWRGNDGRPLASRSPAAWLAYRLSRNSRAHRQRLSRSSGSRHKAEKKLRDASRRVQSRPFVFHGPDNGGQFDNNA